ncbi:MAG: DUF4232 domain-containing protein [Acidimicrobiales bacterium]|jgi:hypothetical protein
MRTTRSLILAAMIGGAAILAPMAVAATTPAGAAVPSCRGTQLAVSFAVVPGSAGAGNVSYALRVRNVSAMTCSVSGLAGLQLLGRAGRRNPTHVTDANPGVTAVIVTLKPGVSAWADGRFSPDVPGLGETSTGQCEPTSYKVSVAVPPRDDKVVGSIRPPTPVCEHGSVNLSLLGSKRPSF